MYICVHFKIKPLGYAKDEDEFECKEAFQIDRKRKN